MMIPIILMSEMSQTKESLSKRHGRYRNHGNLIPRKKHHGNDLRKGIMGNIPPDKCIMGMISKKRNHGK